MSLSVFLVPTMAIGAVTVAVGGSTEELEIELSSLPQNEVYYKLEMKIKDEALLQETLQNYGSHSELENDEVTSKVGDTEITFIKNAKGMYDAYFHEDIALEEAEQFVDNIYEEYTRVVQQKTYEKLIERAGHEGLVLESEETNENDAIVLTFEVKE
ncbi:MAG TPA: hypothetical protein VK085_01655 [Pseudogracilibacillus sp.]|nr:hypothetical protein [Pseudogracilibacillus sp.]